MNNNTLIINDSVREALIASGSDVDMCDNGKEALKEMDADNLVDYYLTQINWCLENNIPDLDTITNSLPNLEHKGIFVNKTFHGEVLNDKQTYVFHNCKGTIKTGLNMQGKIIPMIYLANGCRLRIIAIGDVIPKKKSIIPIYCFGTAKLSAHNNNYAQFRVYRYDY